MALFKTEEEAKEYLNNLSVEYSFSCLKEKNPEGCHLLGDYLEAIKNDFEASGKVYQSNCDDHKYPKSCVKYGNFRFLGKGCEANNIIAFDYYNKACDYGSKEGCLYSGVMMTNKQEMNSGNAKNIPLDYVSGLKLLEKSCSMGNPTACYYASGLYITGVEGIPQDRRKAAEFSKTACDGGNVFACVNLSRMYSAGDGVEKNMEKSELYKQKAREIRDDVKRKPGIKMQQCA